MKKNNVYKLEYSSSTISYHGTREEGEKKSEIDASSGSMVLCQDGHMWEMVDFESDEEIFPCVFGKTERKNQLPVSPSNIEMESTSGRSLNTKKTSKASWKYVKE